MTEVARDHSLEAIETLIEVMRDSSSSAKVRISASNSILDRAFGKPMQAHELSGRDGDPLPSIEIRLVHSRAAGAEQGDDQ